MESVERKVEGIVHLRLRTPRSFKKPPPGVESPPSLLVFRFLEFFDSRYPRSGISVLSIIADQILWSRILSLLSFDLRPTGYHRIDWDNIPCLQKVPGETQGPGQSTNRRHLPSSALLCIFNGPFINGSSKSTLPIVLVPMGTRGFLHGADAKNIFLNKKIAREPFFRPSGGLISSFL